MRNSSGRLWFATLAPFLMVNLLFPLTATAQTAASTPFATSTSVDSYSLEQLRGMRANLAAKAAASGAASETLAHYPGHFTMITYRNQSGTAELHEKFADIFVIVDGAATLESGGTIETPTSASPGEIRGTALAHADQRPLHAGDIVHIPAGTPHLLKLEKNTTLLYYVIKVQQTAAP